MTFRERRRRRRVERERGRGEEIVGRGKGGERENLAISERTEQQRSEEISQRGSTAKENGNGG